MMKIRILQAGRYNDLFLTADDYEPGQVLETHDWYGEELVKKGIAEEIHGTALKSKVQMPKRSEVDTKTSRKTGSASPAPKPSSTPKSTPAPKPSTAPVQQPLTAAPEVSDAGNTANVQSTGEGTAAGDGQETPGSSDGDKGQTE
jgi:hypothetical protein